MYMLRLPLYLPTSNAVHYFVYPCLMLLHVILLYEDKCTSHIM